MLDGPSQHATYPTLWLLLRWQTQSNQVRLAQSSQALLQVGVHLGRCSGTDKPDHSSIRAMPLRQSPHRVGRTQRSQVRNSGNNQEDDDK